MCDDNCIQQCNAPVVPINLTDKIVRCQNVIYKQYHCKDHYDKANKLYQLYKKKCDEAKKLHPENINTNTNDLTIIQNNIKYLFKCYNKYIDAYKSRIEHRNYAFTPETSDYGHNKQIDIILEKINLCTDKLQILYDKIKLINAKKISPSKEKDLQIKEILPEETDEIIEKINQFKNKHNDEEKETQKLIDDYINENKNIYKSRMKIRDMCINLMIKFMIKVNGSGRIHIHYYIGLFTIIFKLLKYNYFNDDFKPLISKCSCCNDISYIPLDIVLDCQCIHKYNCFIKYMSKYLNYDDYIDKLKIISEILIKKSDKIIPLYKNFEMLYKIHGVKILYSELTYIYDPELKTYVLIDNLKDDSQFMKMIKTQEKKQ